MQFFCLAAALAFSLFGMLASIHARARVCFHSERAECLAAGLFLQVPSLCWWIVLLDPGAAAACSVMQCLFTAALHCFPGRVRPRMRASAPTAHARADTALQLAPMAATEGRTLLQRP